MAIEIADDAVKLFYSAAAVLLVERDLLPLVPAGVAEHFTVIPFAANKIGDGASAVALDSMGLPTAPLFVVQHAGSAMGESLRTFAKLARFPQSIAICQLPRQGGLFGGSSRDKLERFLGQSALSVLRSVATLANRREVEVQALRQLLADQNARLGRLRDALAQSGYADEEFSLPFGARPLASDGARSSILAPLYGMESIRLRPTSPDTGRVRVTFTLNGREIETSVAELGGLAPTLDVIVPAELAALRDGSEISVQALRAEDGAVGPGAFGSVLFRIQPGAAAHPPAATSRRIGTHGAAPIAAARIAGRAGVRIAQGAFLDAGSILKLNGKSQSFGTPSAQLAIVPHGASDAEPPTVLATGTGSGRDLVFEGVVPTSGRYDIWGLSDSASTVGRIVWSTPFVSRPAGTRPLAFASARFAALANVVSYCNGSMEELAVNAAQGFSAVAVGDGTSFLQTHPIAGRFSGARLPRLIPYGATSVWIDVENANPLASPFEFLPVIVPAVRDAPVDEWMASFDLRPYEGLSIVEAPEAIIARTVVKGGAAFTFRLDFASPLAFDGTLYCLVRPPDGNVAYGWCRWHRIVVGLPASEALPRR